VLVIEVVCAENEQYTGERQQNITSCFLFCGLNPSVGIVLEIFQVKKKFQFTASYTLTPIPGVDKVWRCNGFWLYLQIFMKFNANIMLRSAEKFLSLLRLAKSFVVLGCRRDY
jgi:hypothetical protein